jgi:hypothetical protein
MTMINLGSSRLVRCDVKVHFDDLQNYDGGRYVVQKLSGILEYGLNPTSDEHIVENVGITCPALLLWSDMSIS